ncbi:MAG: M16 family metallopeptidase [Pyrinomonadaceae bacterium]
MKKILLSSLLALTAAATAPTYAQIIREPKRPLIVPAVVSKQQGLEVPFVNKVLANGLEVIVLRDPSVPIVTVELAARNGSFTEPPDLNGLSHLYEHMFFKTNGAIVRRENYLRDIGQLGITYNGTTREEVVNYYFTTTSPYVSTALRFIKDAVRYPVFDEEEFAQEKQVVVGEIDRNEANPYFYLNRALMDKLFYKYPTRKNRLGTRESVLSATTEKMRMIESRYYVPNNMALVVTGDVNPDEVFKLAEQNFGDWKPRAVDPFKDFPLVEHPPLPKSEGVIVEQPVNNVLIQVGWQGPSIGKDDKATYAADVFSYILSQPDSRFQRKMVDSGLTVVADVGYYTQRNVGPIQMTLVTSPDKAKAALNAAYAELAQFDKPDYFTNEELENAKTILESRDLFDREKLSEYSHTLSFWWSSTGIDYFRGYYKNLRAISRQDINAYVRNYVQDKPHVGVALISTEAQQEAKLTPQDLIGGK